MNPLSQILKRDRKDSMDNYVYKEIGKCQNLSPKTINDMNVIRYFATFSDGFLSFAKGKNVSKASKFQAKYKIAALNSPRETTQNVENSNSYKHSFKVHPHSI